MTIRANGSARRAAALGVVACCLKLGSVYAGDDPADRAGSNPPKASEKRSWWSQRNGQSGGLRGFFNRRRDDRPADPRFDAEVKRAPEPWPDRPKGNQPLDTPKILDRAPQTGPAFMPLSEAAVMPRTIDPALMRTAAQPPLGPAGGGPPNVELTPLATGGNLPVAAASEAAGRPISLQAALYGAVTGNPDLVALRQGQPGVRRSGRGRQALPHDAQSHPLG